MPSDALAKPEPADLDRLMTRIAVSNLGDLEAIILIEVLLMSLDGPAQPRWKEIAQTYGYDPSQVSRTKSILMASNRLTEESGVYSVDLDPAVWFPKTSRGRAQSDLAKRVHHARSMHLSASSSADTSIDQLTELSMTASSSADTSIDQLTKPSMTASSSADTSIDQLTELSSRSPNRNAGAPARGIELNLIERINQFNSGSKSNSAHAGEPLDSHDPSELAKVVALAAREFDQAFADQAELFADQFENLPLLMEAISAMAEESRRAEKEIAHPWPWTDGAGESRDGYVMTVYRNMLAGNRPVRAARRKTEWDEMPAVPPPYVDETPEESRRAFDRQMAAIKKAWAEQDAQKNAPPTPKVRTWPDLIKIAPGFAEFANQ